MTLNVRDAEELVGLAAKLKRTLMVDHTYVYSPAIKKIKSLIDSGELGDIYYVDSVRINLGLFQNDINVLQDLAPHHSQHRRPSARGIFPRASPRWGPATPARTPGRRRPHLNPRLRQQPPGGRSTELAGARSRFATSSSAARRREEARLQRPQIRGSRSRFYDRGITVNETEARRGVLINYRTGDILVAAGQAGEPLQNLVRHFVDCIRTGARPITDGKGEVFAWCGFLEAAQQHQSSRGPDRCKAQ